jgi:hypothetical protein
MKSAVNRVVSDFFGEAQQGFDTGRIATRQIVVIDGRFVNHDGRTGDYLKTVVGA